jgi:hypothetical protein
VTAQWYASLSIDFVSARYDAADRQLCRKPLRLGALLGDAWTENVGFACVTGGMAHHALALKLREQLPLPRRCRLFLFGGVGIGRGAVREIFLKVALRQCARLDNDGAKSVEIFAAVIEADQMLGDIARLPARPDRRG